MIWLALRWCLLWALKLVVVPERAAPDPVIDPNSKCVVCGAREGKLRAVSVAPLVERDEQTGKDVVLKSQLKCEQTCQVCGARMNHDPVHEKADELAIAAGVQGRLYV